MSQMPNVIHVGFSKCASTFLRSYFGEHPQSYLISEAHFFAPFEHCEFDKGVEYYVRLFNDAKSDQLKVESDEHIVLPLLHPVLRAAATTIEAVKQASERIRQTAPDAKIVLIVRNQLDLMLSRYGEYIMGGRDIDFDEFVKEFLACSQDNTNYYQNYYSKVADIFYNDFAPSKVLILLQEDLLKNERNAIQKLCEFVGIDPARFPNDDSDTGPRFWSLDHFRVVARSGKRSKNTGLSQTGIRIMRTWNRLLVLEPAEAHFKQVVARVPYFAYKFGVRAIRVIDYYLPIRLKGNKKSLLTPSIVAKIRGEFAEDNRRFGELLERDLAELGY